MSEERADPTDPACLNRVRHELVAMYEDVVRVTDSPAKGTSITKLVNLIAAAAQLLKRVPSESSPDLAYERERLEETLRQIRPQSVQSVSGKGPQGVSEPSVLSVSASVKGEVSLSDAAASVGIVS